MNEKQACKLSEFIVENSLGYNLKIFYVQDWEIDNENSECHFWIKVITYMNNSTELAISMKHCYNKASECPIIVKFPETNDDWYELKKAMCNLRIDSIPSYAYKKGYLLNKRLEKKYDEETPSSSNDDFNDTSIPYRVVTKEMDK